MTMVFPFTAIVGQDELRRALILNAVRPDIGGVLIRGERGTAKSTAARGLAALLPPIDAVIGCHYACDPSDPAGWCDECRERSADGTLTHGERTTPFVDLPVGATEDRVIGTLNIEQVLRSGKRRFEPGVLAEANRGILYIDEVNLLDDHVVDVLLDAAAMGVNVVEREGVSFSHPSRFVLVGTMNPEEGELRPQLTDRFGLSVGVQAIDDIDARTEILRRRLSFDGDRDRFGELWSEAESALRDAIVSARERLPLVEVTERDLRTTAEIVSAAGVDGHRAELAILKTAQANAAFEKRQTIAVHDLRLAAKLALAHRRRRGPLEGSASDMSAVQDVLDRAAAEASGVESVREAPGEPGEGQPSAPSADDSKSGRRFVRP